VPERLDPEVRVRTLSDTEIAAELAALEGWTLGPEGIRKRYALGSFRSAMQLLNRVADLTDQADHHPDVLIHGGDVTFTLTTHDAGGVTAKDLDLAARIEAIAP
jgi:4a-hydroxytetrahydrobiopterin dehydratase